MQFIIPLQIGTFPLFLQELNEGFDALGAFLGLNGKVKTSKGEVVALLVVLFGPFPENRQEQLRVIAYFVDFLEEYGCNIGI